MDRVLILGYFGAGNFGDDALLTGWLIRHREWLQENGLVADITVGGDELPFGGFIESKALAEFVSALVPKQRALSVPVDAYQALIAPGGSLLQDVTSLKSLLYYLAVIRPSAG